MKREPTLLNKIWYATENTAQERRAAARYTAVENRASLGWRSEGEWKETPARLVDISSNGTCLVAEKPPPMDTDVWVRMEHPSGTDWAEGKVVRLSRRRTVGIAFAEACEYELFIAATHGVWP